MQKLEPRSVGLKPTKIRHVDRGNVSKTTSTSFECWKFFQWKSGKTKIKPNFLFRLWFSSAWFILVHDLAFTIDAV